MAQNEAKDGRVMVKKIALLLVGTVSASLFLSSCANSVDDEYEGCLSQASEASTAVGVNTATEACQLKYQRQNEKQVTKKYQNNTGVTSSIYWDGWMFRKGDLPAGFKNKGYYLYTFARYGVAICEAAMPQEMGKQLGSVGDSIDTRNNPQHRELWQACYEAR